MTTDLVQSKDALAAETQSWASRAAGLAIVDRESCTNASLLLRSIKTLRNGVQAFWEPMVEAAMETKRKAEDARKKLANERDKMEAPLIEAENILKRGLLAFEAEQERNRLAEEQRLQAEAQREAEAVTLAAAAAMELEAVTTGDAVLLQEAADILEQPIEAPLVTVVPQVPKVQGVTYRDRWVAHREHVDVRALAAAVASGQAPVTFLVPDLPVINAFARATKGTQEIPGVRFVNDRMVVARG